MPRRFSVLLAEDDDPLRRCLAELLVEQGWSVHAAGSGIEAVELARQHQPDFSLLDLHLPGLSGLEVLRLLSSEGRTLPSIMMSGEASTAETRLAMRRGVFRFLHKPLDLIHLRQSMDLLIQHHFGAGGR
ncbi:MAG: response regulator [Planctomycetota bacterium]